MKKIGFRCLADINHGWGNFHRLFQIAQNLEEHDIHFFIESSKEAHNICKKKFKSFFLKKNIKFNEEKKILIKNNFDIFIFEGEKLNLRQQSLYKKISKKFIIFDDLLSKKKYISDQIFCCQKSRLNDIKINQIKKKIYYGYEYFPLFFKSKKIVSDKSNLNIPVILGGGNYLSTLTLILNFFVLKKYKLHIYLTGHFKYSKKLKKYLKYKNFKFYQNVENFEKLLPKKIFFCIINGGYNKFTINSLNLPSAIISTRNHQHEISKTFCKYSKNLYLGNTRNLSYKIINNCIEYMKINSNDFKQVIKFDNNKRLLRIISK